MLNGVEPPEIDIQKLIDGDNAAWRAALPYFEPAPLLDYLCTFADCPDVRKKEKRGWRKRQ
jgi:hypothetical protein